MSNWSPNPRTRKEIDWLVEDLFSVTPEVLGIDETITGCRVVTLDPYGVGVIAAHNANFAVPANTITAVAGTPYTLLRAGDTIVVTGTPSNNGTYVVSTVVGDNIITTVGALVATENAPATIITVPNGVVPRYIQVALRGRYYQDVFYRGGLPDLAIGDYLTVIHEREGNRYEVMGPGGASGVIPDPATVSAEYVVMAPHPVLPNERVLVTRQWLALTDGGAGGNATLDFLPDNPARVESTGVVTEYATIQAAINASAGGDWVAVPPGTYVEAITLKDGVPVTELFRHTVTIRQTAGTYTVQTAGTGTFLICVHRIEMDRAFETNTGIFVVYANHTSGVFTIIADLYCRNSITAVNGCAIGLGNWNTGSVDHTGDIECLSTGDYFGCYAARNDSTGTLVGHGDIIADGGTTGFAYGLRNNSTGSLRWWGDLDVDTLGVNPAQHFAVGLRTRGGTTEWHGYMNVHADATKAIGLYASNGAGTAYLEGRIEVWGLNDSSYGILMGSGAACTTVVTFRGILDVTDYDLHAYGTHTDPTYGDGTIWLHADIYVDGWEITRGVSQEGSGTTWHQDGGIDTINGLPIHDLYRSAGTLNVSNSRYDRTKTFGTITEMDGDKVGHHKLASVAVNEGASLVGIQDIGAFYVATDVEGALQEIGAIAPVGGAGSGAANRIAYWSDANTITSDAGLTYDPATDTITIAGNILMADDKFIGITGDIRIEFDSSDGDIMFHLGDAAGADKIQVVDSGGAVVTYIDSDGNVDFARHMAVGGTAVVSDIYVVYVWESTDLNTGGFMGLRTTVDFSPTANFSTSVYGMFVEAQLTTAHARTGGAIHGMYCRARAGGGVTATNIRLHGGYYFVDVEDASASVAEGARYFTPYVDTGSCGQAMGIHILQGVVGIGSITTLWGLYIGNMTAGNTNYAIYCAGGSSYHAGKVSVGGTVAPLAQLHVDQGSASAAIPVLYLDQGDVSEDMIEFACTIGAGNAIEAVGGKILTTTHFIKISLPGALTRYIPCGTIA